MDSKQSITELEEIIRKGSDDINDYFALGVLYLENGNFEKLLSLYDDAGKLQLTNLDHTRILYEKGKALQMLNREEEAAALFRKSLQLLRNEKDSFDSLDLKALNLYNLFLCSLYSGEGRNYALEAAEYFKRLIKEYKIPEEGYLAYSHLAEIYAKLGEYEDALNYYNKAIELSAELSAEKHDIIRMTAGIAYVYGMKGDYRQSVKHFNKALSKAGKTFPTSKIYFDMGRIYFEAEEFDKADESFRNALNKLKDDPILRNNEEFETDIQWNPGTTAFRIGIEKDAVHFFDSILCRIDPDHYYYANINITPGHIYSMKNNCGKALEHYSNALLSPNTSEDEVKMAKECLSQIPVRDILH